MFRGGSPIGGGCRLTCRYGGRYSAGMARRATRTVRVDVATLARLEALATLTGRSVADLVRTASYAGFDDVLTLHAKRAVAEARELEKLRRTLESAAG